MGMVYSCTEGHMTTGGGRHGLERIWGVACLSTSFDHAGKARHFFLPTPQGLHQAKGDNGSQKNDLRVPTALCESLWIPQEIKLRAESLGNRCRKALCFFLTCLPMSMLRTFIPNVTRLGGNPQEQLCHRSLALLFWGGGGPGCCHSGSVSATLRVDSGEVEFGLLYPSSYSPPPLPVLVSHAFAFPALPFLAGATTGSPSPGVSALSLDFAPSATVRNTALFFISSKVLGILLQWRKNELRILLTSRH